MSAPAIEKESSAEGIKRESAGLRGDIAAELAAPGNHFEEHDKLLLKFHGIYQQDDRDSRAQARAREGGGKSYSFMVRVAIPGGALDAEQYLELDRLAGQFANGSLRLTTRQGVQFHGVLKGDLKPAISRIDQVLLTTLAACGDVRRNVMACPAPLADPAHRAVQELARAIARDLEPRSRAYHQIWLDGERLQAESPGETVEPFYGTQYLPRKFKIAVALDRDNCVDVYASDCGLIGVSEGGHGGLVMGYNLIAGGGLGLTHNKPDTFARLATVLGSVAPVQAVEAVRAVAAIFRDHGNRADRRHARLKYLIEEWGVAKFRAELLVRLGWRLREPLPVGEPDQHDHLGTHEQGDGKVFLGVHVESGRIADRGESLLRTGLRAVIERFRPGVRVTPMQSLLLTDLEPSDVAGIRAELAAHGVADVVETPGLSAVRRYAMACPALPTCGLALTDAERALPGVVTDLERELGQLGVADLPLTVRMTGCPNGCARPYNADIGIVGRKPGVYHVLVGGGLSGDRLADLFAADVPVERIGEVLRPLFKRFAAERQPGEGLSDYYQRALGRVEERHLLTGREAPTASRFAEPS
ncbi:MAG: NADPH-dependent assimilatory sulfite reductase hemoprotein subunit [Acidobacteriota bacterium]